MDSWPLFILLCLGVHRLLGIERVTAWFHGGSTMDRGLLRFWLRRFLGHVQTGCDACAEAATGKGMPCLHGARLGLLVRAESLVRYVVRCPGCCGVWAAWGLALAGWAPPTPWAPGPWRYVALALIAVGATRIARSLSDLGVVDEEKPS